ncbi:MAG TPA: hypothetical protein ENI65_10425 [Gammaproteobacteria bacterium]|nr:hypothetical protein [Gammaproteobacteria bacterium]
MHNNQQDSKSVFDKGIEKKLVPYLEKYNLGTLPFSAKIPGNSYFMGADREQHLNHLIHLVQSSDMVSVVVGKEGVGKTCLIQKFIERAPANLRCWYISADPEITANKLLSTIAAKLELPDKLDYKTTLDSLREQARNMRRNDQIPVILADDIEDFPGDTLDALLSLQTSDTEDDSDADSSWGIVLTTQPGNTTRLMQLRSHMHFIQLTELTRGQTGQYILHRMKAAGLKEELPFTPKELEYIYRRTKGKITKIHQLAHEILLGEKEKNNPALPGNTGGIASVLKPRVWIYVTLVVALSLILLFQDDINNLIKTDVEQDTPPAKEPLELPEIQGYLLNRIPDPVPVEISSIKSLHLQKNDTGQTRQLGTPAAKSPPEKLRADDTTDLQPVKTRQAALEPVKIVNTPMPEKTDSRAAKSLATILERHRIKGQEWILKQPPAFYTAQLMASSRPDLLTGHAKNPAFGGKTAIYHIRRGKISWYILVYGSHKERRSSIKSIANLPDILRKNRPWIRTFGAIQAEIQKGSK